MIFTLQQFKQMTRDDLERAKFCQDSSGNIAIRWVQGISAWGNPVETLEDLPETGAIEGEAVVVRGDPTVGSTIMIWDGTQRIQIGAFDYNKVGIDSTDIPDYAGNKLVAGDGIDLVQSTPTPGYKIITFNLNEQELQAIIEAFTALDLSNVQVTLGEIGGDIVFTAGTTIDRTNTENTGEQNFDADYIANYIGGIINQTGTEINNTNTVENNEGVTENYDNTSTTNNNGNTTNNTDTTTNNTNTTTNNEGVINNYDEDSVNNFEGDVYIGGDLYIGGDVIQTTNESNNPTAVTQTGAGQAYTNINNVLICDLAYATATPIDPTLKDSIKLIVGGSIAGNDLGQGITGGSPAIYGNGSELRGNSLTPAIVNNANFGCAFKFGDSQTIQVSNFGFAIPLTNTILGVKVEVVFNSTADTVNVDCITMIVYSTDGSTVETGIEIQEAGVVVATAKKLNFQTGATATDMGGGVVDVNITGGTFTDIGNNYLILTGTMAGTPPEVDIADTRITDTTPYLVFYETEPVGNITRTLTNGNLNIVSDDNADTLDVKVLFWNIGPARNYMKGNTTLTGAGPWVINDSRITATTPAIIVPRTAPVGFLTAVTGAGTMTISSTGTEVGVVVDYIITLDTTNYSDGMSYEPTLNDDDMFFRKDDASGEDKAVKWSDMKTNMETQIMGNNVVAGTLHTAGDMSTLRLYSDGTYTKYKSIEITHPGTYTFSWRYRLNDTGTAYTKVYKNGIAIGPEHTNISGSSIQVSENYTLNVGDTIELWGYASAHKIEIHDCYLKYSLLDETIQGTNIMD